jgi:hypothetical protein
MHRELTLAAVLWAACGAWAQTSPDFFPGTMGKPTTDPEWSESEAPPPPPALRTEGLVPVEVGSAALRFGVDPASVTVGKDRIVRYVIVATSPSGTVNAIYEGIRCDRDEYRVYARHTGQGWHPVDTPWKSVKDGLEANHVRAVARAGACMGDAPSGTAKEIVRNLQARPDRRFGGSSAP